MIEALLDPKTWLFALFSALDNIPNSLTNQRQIIVSSFGFTPLQTTLLGCVDGVFEIMAIFTAVNIAARLPNSIAYVGVLYTIPGLAGVFLINFLPWSNKVGLLFSLWTSSSCPIQPTLYITCSDWHPPGRRWHDGIRAIPFLALQCDCRPHETSDGQRYNAVC